MSTAAEDGANDPGATAPQMVRRDVIMGAGMTVASLPVAARAATLSVPHTPLPPVRQVHAGDSTLR